MDSETDVPTGKSVVGDSSTSHFKTCFYVEALVCLFHQGHDGVVTLCKYPFVFDAQAKTTLLQTDAVIQMQVNA